MYKMVGPVLVKQELSDVKMNVDARIKYLKGELDRIENEAKVRARLPSSSPRCIHRTPRAPVPCLYAGCPGRGSVSLSLSLPCHRSARSPPFPPPPQSHLLQTITDQQEKHKKTLSDMNNYIRRVQREAAEKATKSAE